MAKKAKEKLTTRQKANRRIHRNRQWRKWWQVSQRFFLVSTLICTLAAVGGGWWFWHSGRLMQTVDAASSRFWASTARLGFKVEHVYLEGRNFTPLSDINGALGLRSGDPILSLSLPTLRARLMNVPRIKYAEIDRVLPNQLHIRIVERQPIAVWQNEGKLHLIDDDGIVMEYIDPAQYKNLLLVVGEDAPSHAHALLAALAGEPDLYHGIASASRVGERRWNIRFKNGALLKLPEKNAEEAWESFARIEHEQHLLERSLLSVDMRLSDRVFIKMAPVSEPKSEKQGGSKA